MLTRLALCFMVLFAAWIYALPKPDITQRGEISPLVEDKNGLLLRAFTSDDGRRRMAIKVKNVDPLYLKMLIAYEDQRFYSHYGVDPLALIRAGVNARRVTSGASTLTMQTARLIEGQNTRSLWGKLQQMRLALALERHYTKHEILEQYLTLAPFGGNLEGVRAASLSYFGKEPSRLSPSEAALLVAMPQSPEMRRPDKASNNIKARNRVLTRAYLSHIISQDEYEAAKTEALPTQKNQFPLYAAHYAEKMVLEKRTKTTLDLRFQSRLETLVKEHVIPLNVTAALIVIDNATGETRVSIGGADYFDKNKAGAMDLTRAVRSPGSALKPFIYGMAFDMGLAHPETMLEDRPTRFGLWSPENFDQGFTGAVTARVALQQSLNLPAVELLSKVGVAKFLNQMKTMGVTAHLPKSSEGAGLAVGLGGIGVTLHDLTNAYAKIARGGEGLLSPASAWYLADILKNAPPPPNAPQGLLAFKTGTSYGYRDAWAFGFDRRHTIGVWVGRADNASVNGLIGRLVAAPLLFDAFKRIGHDHTPFPKPFDALVAKLSQLPPPLRGGANNDFKLLFPSDGAKFELENAAIPIKLTGGVAPYFYRIDDAELANTTRKEAQWLPKSAGFTRISVVDSSGKSVSINVRVMVK